MLVVIDLVFAEGGEAVMEQTVGRSALGSFGVALVATHHHFAVHDLGDRLKASPHRLAEGAEPGAVVDHLGKLKRHALAVMERLAVEHELFKSTQRFHENGAARGLVDAAALHANQAILADINATDAVARADGVEFSQKRHCIEFLAVDADGIALLEDDSNVFVTVGRILWTGGDHPDVFWWGIPWVFQFAALMADVPDVCVAAVNLLSAGGGGDVARLEVGQHGLTALQIPDAPRADDSQLRCQRRVRAFETNLIVSLTGAAVAECVGTSGKRHFDLRAGDDWAGDRCAHQVAILVHRSSDCHWECKLTEECLLEVNDDALGSAGLGCLLADAVEFALTLADIRHACHHCAAVGFTKPRNDARGVESAGVGDADFLWGVGGGGVVGVVVHGVVRVVIRGEMCA